MSGFNEYTILNWIASANYSAMQWTDSYWWAVLSTITFIACLIGMAPLRADQDHTFIQIIFVQIRKLILVVSAALILIPILMLYIYDMSMQKEFAESQDHFIRWFTHLFRTNWQSLIWVAVLGLTIRFVYLRYVQPILSKLARKLRVTQSDDKPSDIREETSKYREKDFLPSRYYRDDSILVGISEDNQPVLIPASTWYETNMQVIGPTRYGKGIIIGCIMDQAIRRGDCVVYIDPKKDKFAPHIMYQACQETGRKFYYLTLHDEGMGKWAPFAGGSIRDALARLEVAFGLELTGNPGTDYYKSQERRLLEREFQQTRNIPGLRKRMEVTDANRVNAELDRWSAIHSLCPKPGQGFSIENALKEGAVVYVQGSLDDSVVKMATKLFIVELIQEARRLESSRGTHLTMVIDEVSFLVSKILAQALATAVGFRVNFLLAYQSQNDLLNLDDVTVNPKYTYQSINVNSQIKAVYGGADFETAEWAANLSGTQVKEVSKMEKTSISRVGGEIWENERSIGMQEENYISTNAILSLPPRVCVFIQPRHLASICFSSFVPVKSMELLKYNILSKFNPPTASKTTVVKPQDDESSQVIDSSVALKDLESERDRTSISQAKLDKGSKGKAPNKKSGQEHENGSMVEKATDKEQRINADIKVAIPSETQNNLERKVPEPSISHAKSKRQDNLETLSEETNHTLIPSQEVLTPSKTKRETQKNADHANVTLSSEVSDDLKNERDKISISHAKVDAQKTATTPPINSIQAPQKEDSLTDRDSADTTELDADNESDTVNKNTGREHSKKNYNRRRKHKQKAAKVISKSDPDRTDAISQAKLDGEIRSTALSNDEGTKLQSSTKITSTHPELSIDFIGFEIKSDKETMQQLNEQDEDEQ